jgi:hypothetical protein
LTHSRSAQRPRLAQQALRHLDGVLTAHPRVDEEGQQLRIGQRPRPQAQQPLARPVVHRQILNAMTHAPVMPANHDASTRIFCE